MGAVEVGDRIALPQDEPTQGRVALPMASAATPQTSNGVSLTDRAARSFASMLSDKGESYGALKVAVTGGGCAGYQYAMAIAHAPEPTDIVVESRGVDVFIDGSTAHMMAGAEIDFIDSMMGRGFTVRNPNAKDTCGCGSSFNTDGSGVNEGSCTH